MPSSRGQLQLIRLGSAGGIASSGRVGFGTASSSRRLIFFFLLCVLASKESKMSASVHLHLAKTMAET